MIAFPDTSFLYAIYRKQVNSPVAAAHYEKMSEALAVSSLLLFEFRQSVRFQNFLNDQDASKGFSRSLGATVLRTIQSDIAGGVVAVVAVDWPDFFNVAERLSSQYTLKNGHRAMDIMHVATALQLGAKEFLSFDENQRILARAEGLKVPL